MKFYKRDPDRALAGMAELTLKQRGAYNSLLDLLYSRDGDVPDDDARVSRMISCHWREWATIKAELIAVGKVWVEGGKLCAKRVQDTIKEASDFSQEQSKKASRGWKKRKNNNEINETEMPYGNALTPTPTPTPRKERTPKGPQWEFDFEEFWSAFPKRDGSNPRAPAEAAYRRARGGGASHAELLEGAKAYAAAQKREHGAARSRYTTMASTWLNQRRWESEAPKPNGHAPAHTFENFTEDEWVKWLDYCRPRGEWAKWLGPPPFTPGCKAPAHLLVDRDRKMTVQVAN